MGPKRFLRLAFYMDGKFLEIPDSWEKVVEKIRQNGVRIIVIDTCSIQQDCPDFYKNWKNQGLFSLKSFIEERGKCSIEVFRVN